MSQLRTISNRFIVGILIFKKKTPKMCDAGDLPNFFIYVCVSLVVTEK